MMTAKEHAAHIVRKCEERGHKFKPDVIDAVAAELVPGNEYKNVAKAIDAYRIPTGIEMPWGIRVVP